MHGPVSCSRPWRWRLLPASLCFQRSWNLQALPQKTWRPSSSMWEILFQIFQGAGTICFSTLSDHSRPLVNRSKLLHDGQTVQRKDPRSGLLIQRPTLKNDLRDWALSHILKRMVSRGTSDQAILILFHCSKSTLCGGVISGGPLLLGWDPLRMGWTDRLWSFNFKLSLLLLIALLIAIRIDDTSERKSAILLNKYHGRNPGNGHPLSDV